MKDFNDTLLEQKELLFRVEVENVLKNLKIRKKPKIKFWDCYCPTDDGDELAHIHTDSNTICVSRIRLKCLNFDEIRDIARHEVTHMIHRGHGSDFHNTKINADIFSFRGNTCTVCDSELRVKPINEKIDKIRCNYHLCREKRTLKICEYCNSYFCDEHMRSKSPSIPKFKSTSPKIQKMMDEWRQPGGHPCPPYVDHMEIEFEKEKIAYRESLDKLIKSGPPLRKKIKSKKKSKKKRRWRMFRR